MYFGITYYGHISSTFNLSDNLKIFQVTTFLTVDS